MRLVLDASVVIELLLKQEPFYTQIKQHLQTATSLSAPHLLDIEATQVLRRFVMNGEISQQRAENAIEDLQNLPIEHYPHSPFLPRVFQLKNNLTAYDALYVALAEELDAELLTRDKGMGNTPNTEVMITVIGS